MNSQLPRSGLDSQSPQKQRHSGRLHDPPKRQCGRYHGIFAGSKASNKPGSGSGCTVLQVPNSTNIVASGKMATRCQKLALCLNTKLERDLADIEKSRREATIRHRREVERIWTRFEHVRYAVSVPLDELDVSRTM
jgi:hypothetical protein